MDREAVCGYIHSNFDDLKFRAISAMTERYNFLTPSEVCDRFLRAGEKYGTFDIESISTEEELEAEFLDIISYIALRDLQSEE